MTNLKCSVINCIHNCSHLCEMNTIEVKGRDADTVEETCCSTFRDGGDSISSNSSKEASLETHVGCSANACKYNKDNYCYAEHIDISGSGADNSQQTACATFEIA